MAADDKGKEYPCSCGKVFRRQLALERHQDVHHSSKSVAHKCDVCQKTFGTRKTLTMHRAVHGTPSKLQVPTAQEEEGGPATECTSPTTSELDAVMAEFTSDKNNSPNPSESPDDVPIQMTELEKIAAEAVDHVTTDSCQFDEVELAEVSVGNGDSNLPIFHSNVRCLPPMVNEEDEDEDELDDIDVTGDSKDLTYNGHYLPSGVLGTKDGTDQSVDFSEMLVEEIVSESLFQTSADPIPDSSSNFDWIGSDEFSSSSLADEATTTSDEKVEVSCQILDGFGMNVKEQLSQRRINRVRPEARKGQYRPRQMGRGSDEFQLESEAGEELSGGMTQKDNSGSRLLNSNRTPFVCGICHKSFDSEKYLSMHMPLHKPYIEPTEITIAVSSSNLEILETQVLQGQPVGAKQKKLAPSDLQQWTCQYCNKSFMQNSNYKNHMRTHSDERPFVCEICNIGFKERYHLKKHVLFKHTTDLKETCRVCGKCFKDSTAVRAHERIHSELRPYSCNLCGKTFKTSECLWHHENRSKTCGKSAIRRGEAGALAEVGASLALATNVAGAVPTRRPRKPRQAVVAGSKARTPRRSGEIGQGVLNNNTNFNVKQYFPLGDGKKISPRDELEASVMAIKTEPDCDLFDSTLQALYQNEQELENIWGLLEGGVNKDASSTEETGSDITDSDNGLATKECEDFSAKCKGLECTKCVKKFSSAATFEKHMVMHNEERPYRCTLCDNGFKLKVHLKKHHLYRHSNEYPCECSICGKRFKDSSAVRLHEKIHSSDRPFRCHCGKSFKTKENLWGHRNRGPCEKTQDFIANNIRLFRSTEFGPILGVPITSGSTVVVPQTLASAVVQKNCAFVDGNGRTISVGQIPTPTSAQTMLLKTAQDLVSRSQNSVPHSVQFVPSYVISTPQLSAGQTSRPLKLTTLKLIKPCSSIDSSTHPTSILPTAIVTPLPRTSEPSQTSSQQQPTNPPQTLIKTTAKTTPGSSNSAARNASPPNKVCSLPTTSSITGTATISAQSSTKPAVDVTRGRSTAGKYPTIQRNPETSSHPPVKLLEINQPLGNVAVVENACDQDSKPPYKRRKLNSIGDDISSVEGEDKASRNHQVDQISSSEGVVLMDQESQDSKSLPYLDPLLTNSPNQGCYASIYPDIDDYDDVKYDPNDPTLTIGDVYWGDNDNTLSSGWLLENESLFNDFPLTSPFGIL